MWYTKSSKVRTQTHTRRAILRIGGESQMSSDEPNKQQISHQAPGRKPDQACPRAGLKCDEHANRTDSLKTLATTAWSHSITAPLNSSLTDSINTPATQTHSTTLQYSQTTCTSIHLQISNIRDLQVLNIGFFKYNRFTR